MLDPDGQAWYYVQKTGELIWRPEDPTQSPEHVSHGFSGKKGKDRNNPESEGKPKRGPIPVGGYTIKAPRDHMSNGKPLPYNLPLTPDPDNDMHGRDGFLIHGGSEKQDPSEGCIILPRPVRERIWKSGDHHIEVV